MYTFSEKLRRVQKLNQNFLQIYASTHHVLTLQSVTKFYRFALTNRFSRIFTYSNFQVQKGNGSQGKEYAHLHRMSYISTKFLRNSFEQQFKQDWMTDWQRGLKTIYIPRLITCYISHYHRPGLKVDQHALLNGFNHEDSTFK